MLRPYFLVFIFISLLGFSQEKTIIDYKIIENGIESTDLGKYQLIIDNELCKIDKIQEIAENEIPTPEEFKYVNYGKKEYTQIAKLNSGEIFNNVISFSELPALEETDELEIINGYKCKKLTTVIFSNQVEIWYTTEINSKGTPWPEVGIPEGLVLKIVRNGNYEIVAEAVSNIELEKARFVMPKEIGKSVEKSIYLAKIRESYITTINVFNNEQICWGYDKPNPENIESNEVYHYAGGTLILRKVNLPRVSEDNILFAEITQYSNGDAYDRTASVFIIPTNKEKSFLDGLRNGKDDLPKYFDNQNNEYQGVVATDKYLPITELVRFFTPFGINHFNDKRKVPGLEWEDSVIYKQDISSLLPILEGDVWIGAFIGNYDKGGHKLSLNLKYYPMRKEIVESTKKHWIYPLFNTLNVLEMAGQSYATMFDQDSLKVQFEIPKGVKNLKLQYISTGHGGWGGGDEFNQKLNEIFIDGKLVYSCIPWRTDCSSYRKYNPASGNFWSGISSSDFSRSGWCPGTITFPQTIILNLESGTHELKVAIPLGPREGNSFSAWNISGVLIGEFD